jgi:hypothetical protein
MRVLNDINLLIAATEAEFSELNTRRSELIARLAELQHERATLLRPIAAPGVGDSEPIVTNQSSQEEKIALFRRLFLGREEGAVIFCRIKRQAAVARECPTSQRARPPELLR